MSRGRKSSYPEYPQGGKRPAKPGEGRHKPSSEHISGKRKGFFEIAAAATPKGPRETYDKLDTRLTSIGHMNPALKAFLKDHVFNRVPVHVWGKHAQSIEV